MATNVLRDLLDLPAEVKKSDFVVQLTDGVAHPEALLRNYAVTTDILRAFDLALDWVRGALRDGRSTAAYVHGSFGSGKSHFMAVLSLILSGDPTPWRSTELHEVLARHEWVKEKKLLRLHLNMAAARSLEDKVFPEYLRQVRRLHLDASIPALFADQAVFDNARMLRERLGDAQFFASLNPPPSKTPDSGPSKKKGWAKLHGAWDAASFEAAMNSDASEDRERLLGALVRTLLPAFAQQTQGFIDVDRGLGVMARHAARLGYDGVVLMFDELVLWLSSLAGDRVRLNSEVQKLSKLVDAQDMERDIPLVSFVARQRDIGELVGNQYAGADAHILQEALRLWQGRFGTVLLDDRNLPAVIEKRVVRPKDSAARKRLEDAFSQMRRGVGQAFTTLLGEKGDEKAFRQVYPFSPALVEVLISMSHYLQRQRTALKLLMEMLTEHMEDFEIGKVVPIGDLYDVLAGSEEPLDGLMRERFASAKRLYQNDLLPVIQSTNGTTTEARCQRLRPGHPVTVGCSNCRETRCRADNRLVKTLLLAALVSEVPVLKNLTVSRLVQLNHGTLKVVVPGTEATQAAERLSKWGTGLGKLHIQQGADPAVWIELTRVDLAPILAQARYIDQPGARRRKLQELLFAQLGVTQGTNLVDHKVTWRNTGRLGQVYFGNVREMEDGLLRAASGHDFKVVVDYPFDDPGHGPSEDDARVAAFLARGDSSPTIVWLPSFFSEDLQKELGDLVVVEEVLADKAKHLSAMRADDQSQAQKELENLRAHKRLRLERALDAAYGLRPPEHGQLDEALVADRHFRVLTAGVEVRNVLAARLNEALQQAIEQLLEQRFPRHPRFSDPPTPQRLASNLQAWRRLCEAEGQRLPIDRADREQMTLLRDLDFAGLTDAAALLQPRRLQELENALRQRGLQTPDVGEVKRLFDPQRVYGLSPALEDFVVLCYAIWTQRELYRGSAPLGDVVPGKLPDEAELRQPRLPKQTDWQSALDRAGKLFGISLGGRALNGRNLRELGQKLTEALERAQRARADQIESLLTKRAAFYSDEPARVRTAQAVRAVLAALDGTDALAAIEALAGLEVMGTSLDAMAKHLVTAEPTAQCLQDDLVFETFGGLAGSADPAAQGLLTDVATALSADELERPLAPSLRQLALHAQRLRAVQKDPPPPRPPTSGPPTRLPIGEDVVVELSGTGRDAFGADEEKAKAALKKAGAGARIELTYTFRIVKPRARQR